MNTSGLRRNFKNIVHNYSDAQVKVREATSNDPWGPSSTLMSEIADYTYNVVAFSEIMQMIWKRLNDHGKNWRHVYKALVLLEYLIKTGTEKVAQQCKENIFAIQTLKDFQYFEENKDHGMNVREKAKQLVALLKDDERLKNERMRALKARERFAQATAGIGSDLQNSTLEGDSSVQYRDAYPERISPRNERRLSSELECARPQTAGEEELQLQLALAMSKEEAEQEEQKRRSDDVRLQMAITQSEEDFGSVQSPGFVGNGAACKKIPDRTVDGGPQKQSNLVDLLDMSIPGPSNPTVATDPWGLPMAQPMPAPRQQQPNDPWAPVSQQSPLMSPPSSNSWMGRPASSLGVPTKDAFSKPANDPWSMTPQYQDPWGVPVSTSFGSSPSLATNGEVRGLDQMGLGSTTSKSTNDLDAMGGFSSSAIAIGTPNPFDVSGSGSALHANAMAKSTPESFLGPNSNLVNLDALISSKPPSQMPGPTNPFAVPSQAFQPPPPPRVSLNQIRTQQQFSDLQLKQVNDPFAPQMPNPLVPANPPTLRDGGQPVANNPFL